MSGEHFFHFPVFSPTNMSSNTFRTFSGFSIIEIIVSITIFVIFVTGYLSVTSQDAVVSESDTYLFWSSRLMSEVQEVVRNRGAAYFSSGSWSMVSSSGSYVFYSGASLSSGLYVDTSGQATASTSTGVYRRELVFSPLNAVYTGSTAKAVTLSGYSLEIRIWYPGCNFSGSRCAYRTIMLY